MSVTEMEVRVPATSANLGCAFDCAALAVNRYVRARASVIGAAGIAFFYKGAHSARIPSHEPNLLTQAIQRFAESRGKKLPGLRVDVESEIPVGVGLGSSAAAIVAGLVLGAKVLGVEIEASEIVSLAAKIEGHPDNTTAAFLGGLTVAFLEEQSGRVLSAKAQVPPDLRIIGIVPDVPLATHTARAVLPATYSREDVVHNLQRTALLTAACFSGSFAIEPELFRDRLHQPYRSRLIPGLESCLDVKHPALLGVFLSGAGSSVLAFARERETEIAELLVAGFRRHGIATQTLFLQAENRGVMNLSRDEATKI
jgi:homoserine kinase